jgi:hypothetical protein
LRECVSFERKVVDCCEGELVASFDLSQSRESQQKISNMIIERILENENINALTMKRKNEREREREKCVRV